ncbi:MAG TPA: cytochrome c family protein [Paracoccaceae bacterium]|nr:cytochrome c family protein [Paracoccaceae bacterium]
MPDTMTFTKVLGAVCGSLLVYLLGAWAAESLYHTGGGHGEMEQAYVIDTGVEETAEATEEGPAFAEVFAVADAAAGEKVWSKCRACHKVDGSDGVGPHLNGVVGRAIAASAGFGYSDALIGKASEAWTPENLEAFLTNPKGWAPGTKMSFAGLPKVEERANLIAWLATQP